ncbi:MAG: hypothetical protein PVG66_00185 [Chromatiales bacterium]|jgi:hypothetical protein
MKKNLLLLSVLLLSSASVTMAEESACLKRVFNQFCLAGDINQLMQQRPDFYARQTLGDKLGVTYGDGQSRIFVMAYKNRIYKVAQRFRPATRMRFEDIKMLLEGKYGQAQDLSRFPEDAENTAAKIGAVYRGEARMQFQWQPEKEWLVTLQWDRESGLNLYYSAAELQAEAEASLRQGF